MLRARIIPCLLLKNAGLVKTVAFRDPAYVGDAINAVRIFNDKEADELLLLDIEATRQGRGPNYQLLAKINREAFMPFTYGGGVTNLDQVRQLLHSGLEKVAINSAALHDPGFIRRAAELAGSQSIVGVVDVKRDRSGVPRVYDHRAMRLTDRQPAEWAQELARNGAGEILLQDVDRDGGMAGYDLDLVRRVADAVELPLVALGGAGSVDDLARAITVGGASAAAAGSLFVFYGRHRAVLISYPARDQIMRLMPQQRQSNHDAHQN